MNACDQALPNITALKPYQPGKPIEELERELGLSNIIKLTSNENPLGPSKSALNAIVQASKELTRYPDGNGFSLKAALAKHVQLTSDQITLGNGSNDVLELLARTFVSSNDEVIFSQYAFAVYPLVTQAIGAKAVIAPASDFGHDLDAMTTLISEKTKLIFIANPNNPTGTALAPKQVETFLKQVPESVIVVLDEAYVEYTTQQFNTVAWLAGYPNLVITRTFSKAYGLAALRVGYSLSSPEIADCLNRIRQPFNVNSLALVAAVAALADKDYVEQSRQLNEAGLKQYVTGFEQLGLTYIPSKGNFITVDVKRNADSIYQSLLQQGVIVRPIANYGLPQHLRISVGLGEENQRCLDALAIALEQEL
ncbi:MAG: histidinol-phosphate transaminase [Gammaproteobacteria bacterium]|jgi:histidinol-phosphate aminotransferase|nr:histidinol-phosphate transaminase [Gammaproteobacteria bacterium]